MIFNGYHDDTRRRKIDIMDPDVYFEHDTLENSNRDSQSTQQLIKDCKDDKTCAPKRKNLHPTKLLHSNCDLLIL